MATITMKQRLEKMRKLYREYARCYRKGNDFDKHVNFKAQLWAAFQSIVHAAKFPGVQWDVVKWTSNPEFSKFARWSLEIHASLDDVRGDMPAISKAVSIDSAIQPNCCLHGNLTQTIEFDVTGRTVSLVFRCRKEARQFLVEHKILLCLDRYSDYIQLRHDELDRDMSATRKLALSLYNRPRKSK